MPVRRLTSTSRLLKEFFTANSCLGTTLDSLVALCSDGNRTHCLSELRYENHVTAAISLALPTFRQRKRNVGLSHQTLFPLPPPCAPPRRKRGWLARLAWVSGLVSSIRPMSTYEHALGSLAYPGAHYY